LVKIKNTVEQYQNVKVVLQEKCPSSRHWRTILFLAINWCMF